MDLQTLKKIIKDIEYKPNTSFKIGVMGDGWYIQHVQLIADCKAKSLQLEEQKGRKLYISQHMCDSEVIQTALCAVLMFEEHEAREWFTYQGEELYGPHIDVSRKETRA